MSEKRFRDVPAKELFIHPSMGGAVLRKPGLDEDTTKCTVLRMGMREWPVGAQITVESTTIVNHPLDQTVQHAARTAAVEHVALLARRMGVYDTPTTQGASDARVDHGAQPATA